MVTVSFPKMELNTRSLLNKWYKNVGIEPDYRQFLRN